MHKIPAALVFALVCAPTPARTQEPIDLSGRLALFVDRHLIAELDGARLLLHHPRPAEVVLRFDRPWEGALSGYFTILHEPGRYRMYYRGRPLSGGRDGQAAAREVTCTAESADGIHWRRPSLGLFEVGGTGANNIVLVAPSAATHNFCPFLDERPGVAAAERYKALGGLARSGLLGFLSGDGIHWRAVGPDPLIRAGAFDSQNVAFWSAREGCYICYLRTWKDGVRWISRATSKDFRRWSAPREADFGGAPPEQLYTSQLRPYFREPSLYLGVAARFQPGRSALSPSQVKALELGEPRCYRGLPAALSDAVLLTSRAGARIERTFLESFVRPGRDARNWTARCNYPALGVVPTAADEMSIYVQRHYGQPDAHLQRFTLRTDGFASVHGPYGGGELGTRAVLFKPPPGTPASTPWQLVLNFATSAAGGIRVEIADERGAPLPGFGLEDSIELIGDAIARPARWRGGANLAPFAGRPLRLRFALHDADLYSFCFRPADRGTPR